MLGTDIATILSSTSAGTGFVLTASGTSGTQIFGVPFPPEATDAAACVIAYGGEPPLLAFGSSLNPGVAMERPRFQVVVRDRTDNQAAVAELAQAAYLALRHFNGVIAGTTYAYIKPVGAPFFLKFDENQRALWACNFSAIKGESA